MLGFLKWTGIAAACLVGGVVLMIAAFALGDWAKANDAAWLRIFGGGVASLAVGLLYQIHLTLKQISAQLAAMSRSGRPGYD